MPIMPILVCVIKEYPIPLQHLVCGDLEPNLLISKLLFQSPEPMFSIAKNTHILAINSIRIIVLTDDNIFFCIQIRFLM